MIELTAGRRTGLHRYTFPPSDHAHVIIDLTHILTQGWGSVFGVSLNISYYYRILYVYLYSSDNFISSRWINGAIYSVSHNQVKGIGQYTGGWNNGGPYKVYFCSQFDTNATGFATFWDGSITNGSTHQVGGNDFSLVGISFISADQACKSAETEAPDFDFDATQQSVVDAWERELSRIRVDGGSTELQKIFYSTVDIVRSLIDIYEHVGYMPDGRSGMYNGITQGGSNADMLVAELYLKKLGMHTIDWKLAYEALLKDAEVDPWEQGLYEGRLFLTNYKELGYIPSPVHRRTAYAINPCSRTLEYSANDYSIALMAKVLYKNGGETPFYEGTSWEYSLDIPHDVKRLISLSGGPDAFEKRLDETFSSGYLSSFYNIGAMGSWFAFHAMGIFPLAGQDVYLINSPHFEQTTIVLSIFPMITFTIKANNLSNDNIYVQSAKINGIEWHKTWFKHSDIANGAILELEMGNKVSQTWGIIDANGSPVPYPPSLSDDIE
ncbi:8308_t:CDS:2 [Racocetra fulgida]|uniref:8308_t:CDS:1 n=1 Tax=Racocetra fulgida TaxID=60492 RepID=A0A9N9A4J6_9GLOM|nr:8308_t:CDS:2 [Racocetra fulgida]